MTALPGAYPDSATSLGNISLGRAILLDNRRLLRQVHALSAADCAVPMLYAAAMLWQIKRPKLRALAITACLLFTALYALSFVNMYNTPHSWVDASKWIYRHVEPGAVTG